MQESREIPDRMGKSTRNLLIFKPSVRVYNLDVTICRWQQSNSIVANKLRNGCSRTMIRNGNLQ
jgi:hypothetical protein